MVWVIADVHGCAETLKKLVDRVLQADPQAQFVFTGDYCDRGMKSKEVVDYLLTLDNVLSFLRGNHDDVIDWLLNEHSFTDMQEQLGMPPSDESIIPWWKMNGFISTLESYGVSGHLESRGPYNMGAMPSELGEEFRDKVPDSHKEFYRNLEVSWENDTHFAVHAWADPKSESPLEFQEGSTRPLWNRFPRQFPSGALEYIEPVWDKIGVFGHTPVSYYRAAAPIKMEKIRLIDCCAFDNEYLTAYCCESDDWILQATEPEDGRK